MTETSRWQLTADQRAVVIDRLIGIVGSSESKPRDVNGAVRNLIAIEQQNQKDEHTQAGLIIQRLLEVAAECGVTGIVEAVTEYEASSGGGIADERGGE